MPFDQSQIEAVLSRTPATLSAWLEGMPETWTRTSEGPGTWTPHDIVGHLLHCEDDDWMPRARIILSDAGDRRFAPFERFAPIEGNRARPFGELLAGFTRRRAENLSTLRGWTLADADLDRTGEHPQFGPVTLRQLLATWAVHDLSHIAQIARVLCRGTGDATGPWREYLPLVRRTGTD